MSKCYIGLVFFYLIQICVTSVLQAQEVDPKKAAIAALSREEKNKMINCPLHNKHMGLSDNYKANPTEENKGENYPFAYQLSYRRYCSVCTKIMDKEAKNLARIAKQANNKATNERCTVHSQALFMNPDYDANKSVKDKDRRKTAINAKQYKGRLYCKTCTKVLEIHEKEKNK